jgi:hypothetical protein
MSVKLLGVQQSGGESVKLNRIQLQAGLTMLMTILLFGLIGVSDYEQALCDARFYCEQVKVGAWPDFKGNYWEVCHDGG